MVNSFMGTTSTTSEIMKAIFLFTYKVSKTLYL